VWPRHAGQRPRVVETGQLPLDAPARFFSKSGLLTARRQGDWIELDFPAEPASPVEPPVELIDALGLSPSYVGRNRIDYLVQVDSEEMVSHIQPDLNRLLSIPHRGLIVTAPASRPGFDFVSRFFAPRLGIAEDPVTGSAHCCLGPFWQARLNKDELLAYQSSARGGVVRVRPAGERVYLGGKRSQCCGESWYENPGAGQRLDGAGCCLQCRLRSGRSPGGAGRLGPAAVGKRP